MAEQSPIVPSDLDAVSSSLLACDYLRALLMTREHLHDFLAWMLQENGELTDDFVNAVLSQLLFDETKFGWYLRTNVSTGKLELIEKIPLSGLDASGGTDGDTIVIESGVWVTRPTTSGFFDPSVGVATVPAVVTGGILSVAHGLGAEPNNFRCYLVCNTIDAGYAVGDRVDAANLLFENPGVEFGPAVTLFANATTVGAVFRNGAGAHNYQLHSKSTYSRATIVVGSWNVKFYAAL